MSNDTLQVRRIGIDTYHENVAYLNRECGVYRAEGFQALSKVLISTNGSKVLAVLNVVDDSSIVQPGELGLSEQAFSRLSVAEGSLVTVNHAEPPKSMDAVRRKINGERLDQDDFNNITNDIVETRYSKMEMAAFLVATGQNNLDRDELFFLTRAMLQSGDRMNWHEALVADKHCIGGIPGNRTSMLVVPIVAAHGMLIPKTSSRAITSPAGTADTMELLAEVNLTPEQLHEIVGKERGCLAWGGTAKLAPVDDMLISVERPLGIDSQGQMVASILSKKLAAGSTHLLIDIPVGPTAKVRHMNQALALRKLFEFVGDRLNIHLEVMITDGRQPIGRGIGPVLEARDIMQVLKNDPDAPFDLRQKSLQLAGRIIEFDPDVRGGQGYAIARDILDSGRALAKMDALIRAQGAKVIDLHPGNLCHEVVADCDGVVISIDNFQMATIARLAGAPMMKKAGVDLLKKMGDPVKKGDVLYRIYAEFPADFKFAQDLANSNNGYTLGSDEQIIKSLIAF
ncbi:thymidine phosphorylase family protein [Methylobacter sp. Wu8]|uniref:Putative thymidine phosphorylase n=1 Tax=Methylobacter tundripaludum TaxID=173365 RepID=A0A2S6H4G3_9GAMM|nr:thymidine phosphorylase family protein [Methylobacter tundripaludum]MCF7964236.1 thymidine phosphorylase family protein [Methylobacter tundripaludum]MCK9636749.1 thymidine phosphorylase family protein [Methylobacter tundripaludum]PPK72276.1 thymidine phosphorylase [Methylobacter tundripaludum]